MTRIRIATAAVAAGTILAIPSTEAASVKVFASAPMTATFKAQAGELNALTVTQVQPGSTVFTDTGAILTAGAGCTALAPNSVGCAFPAWNIDVDLRDGDDRATVTTSFVATVSGGGGNDTLTADSFSDFTSVYGDGGDDEVTAGGEGHQIADGGSGDDIVHAGGFAGQATGLGGSGDDIVYFRTVLLGTGTLDGGNGADTIVAQPVGSTTATGGQGDDIIVVDGNPPNNLPNGTLAIAGNAGDDTVIGGPGNDTVDAGDGRDFVDVRDGGADTVSCGTGADVVRHDATDTIAADCELLIGP